MYNELERSFLEYQDFKISLDDFYVSRSFDAGLETLKNMCLASTAEVIFIFKIDGNYWYNMTGEFIRQSHPIFPYWSANQKGINLSSIGCDIHPLICEKFRFSAMLTRQPERLFDLPWECKKNYLKAVQKWARFRIVGPSDNDIDSYCFYMDSYPNVLRNFYIVSPYGVTKMRVLDAQKLREHCLSQEIEPMGHEVFNNLVTMEDAIRKICIPGVFDIEFYQIGHLRRDLLQISDEEMIKSYDNDIRIAFLQTVRSANLPKVKEMLAKFPDLLLATSTTDGLTVLHYATMSGIHKESLDEPKLLLNYLVKDCNVDVKIVNKHGKTAKEWMLMYREQAGVEPSSVPGQNITSIIEYLDRLN